MEKMVCLGLALGALGGGLAGAKRCKMRSLVKRSQEEFIDKVNEAVDARLDAMERDRKRERD